jgi:mannose-1-phosphate guanylyltransferase
LKALILAGGFGTRLRPLSCTRPKILFPIVNKPLLQWTFERLARYKINEVIIGTNYQTEVAIRQCRIPKQELQIVYSRDPPAKPLGSGGPIKKAEKSIGQDEPFLTLNGDIFADVEYPKLLALHEKKSAVATIALHRVDDPSRYGVAELSKDSRIKMFIEKPTQEIATSALVNAGAYVLSPRIFEYVPEGRAVSIEREVFPKLAEEGLLYGYASDGLWMDIGKPEDYLRINRIMLDSSTYQPRSKIGKGITIRKPCALGKEVDLGKKSVIGPYVVLGRNVAIGEGVHVKNSVILPGTAISDFSTIDGALIGEGVLVGKKVNIGKGCILGDHVRIGDNVTLAQGVLVCPAKEISESVTTSKCVV